MTPTATTIRTQAILRSLFPPTTLEGAVRHLGLVQADPLALPARAQDLILRHRVQGYRVGDLDRQYPDLALAEDFIHVYGFMPTDVLALLHPRTGDAWPVDREYPGLAVRVLEFVRANGPTDHRALEAQFGRDRTRSDWGGQAKATTKVLDLLHYRGLLRVARRDGLVRTYVAATPPDSGLAPAERLRRLVLLLARLYAPIPLPTLKLITRLRWAAPGLPDRAEAIAEMLRSGELAQAKVDRITYVWPAGGWAEGEVPQTVRLLAPFDPVVWDRDRFEHLWGWPFRHEAYTPAAKRQFGHYVLPMLWGDQVIGWATVSLKDGRMEASFGYAGERPSDPAFDRELEAELERMRNFLGAKEKR